jgi:hypothetical protein
LWRVPPSGIFEDTATIVNPIFIETLR